jgi:hypothetical protein
MTLGPLTRSAWLLLLRALGPCEPPAQPFGEGPVPTPQLFAPGVISTPFEDEAGITFSPDAREAYFTRGGGGRGAPPRGIYVSRFEQDEWRPAEPASFSEAGDEAPFLTADGGALLFSSRRPVPGWGFMGADANLWMVERVEGGWSRPVPLPGEVNKPRVDEGRGAPSRSESGPVLLADGTLLYWTNQDSEWGNDLYAARRSGAAFVDPSPLHINSAGSESHAALSPDGRWLVFQAFRDIDAIGEEDLYLSERTAYGWGPPRLLPEPLNSPGSDGYPSFSPDGRWFLFASERGEDPSWSIYYVEVEAMGLEAEVAP